MKLSINNIEFETSKHILFAILEEKDLVHRSGIAVAVNNKVVPKKDWQNYTLNNDDNIMIITAFQGG